MDRSQPRQMSSHTWHEKFEEHKGGKITPRAPDRPLQVRPSSGREDDTDGPTASEGHQVQLGRPMRRNFQTVQGIPDITSCHPEAETQPPNPGIWRSQRKHSVLLWCRRPRARNDRYTSSANPPRGRDEIPYDREGGSCPSPHSKTNAPLLPKPLNNCKDRLSHF